MKTTRFHLVVLTVAVCGIAFAAGAEEEIVTNRLSLSARLGFNISARFKNVAPTTGIPGAPRPTPHGDPYNYNDGYVLPDRATAEYGNNDGLTWYWGYDDRTSQLNSTTLNLGNFNSAFPDNTILMNRLTTATGGGASRDLDDNPFLGGELTYDRFIGIKGNVRYGIEAAVNYLNLSLRANNTFMSSATRVTDAYPFTPGTTPPDTASGPYQGSYPGPGFVIGNTPVGSATVVVPGETVTDRQRLDADLWGFRLGPYVEMPLGGPVNLLVSGGLAVGLLDASASWSQTSASSTLAGSGDDGDVLWGGYVSAAVTWYLSERWSLMGGGQFQSLGHYDHAFGGRVVEVDLSNSWFVTLGLSYKF